jgi:hypothetical protein
LLPWTHFIPITATQDELKEIILDWIPNNQSFCKEISENANSFINGITYEDEVKRMTELMRAVLSCQKVKVN